MDKTTVMMTDDDSEEIDFEEDDTKLGSFAKHHKKIRFIVHICTT